MTDDTHEQLSNGVGSAAPGGADADDTPTVRVVPIGEGDVTEGLSGERVFWGRDTLKEAVESGALDGAKLIKGQPGSGHKDSVAEQAAPEDIIGRIDEWSYEDGVGPVGESVVVDDQMATRIEHGLLDVSPDLYRRLGNYDEDLDAKPASEILAMPYITVLDRGAGDSASIEPATAEALGYNPDGDPQLEEYADVGSSTNTGDESDEATAPMQEQLADVGDAVRWESSAGGSREPDSVRYGVVVDGLQDEGENEVLVAVYQPDENYEEWESRGEQNPMNQNNLETVGSDGVDSLPAISQVVDSEQAGDATDPVDSIDGSDGRAESRTGADGAGDNSGDSGTDDSQTMDKDKLRDQLSDAQNRVADLEETKEQLAEKNDELAEQLSSVREERDELEDENDDLEEKLSDLRDDFGPIKQAVAQLAADGSHLSGDQVADRFTGDEIMEMLADEDDERSPSEQVKEQLAGGVEPRGDTESNADGSDNGPEDFDDEQLAAANELAYEVMGGSDIAQAQSEQLSAREFVKEHKGVDPAKVGSAAELRSKVDGKGGDA